jgi:hypothetical protein
MFLNDLTSPENISNHKEIGSVSRMVQIEEYVFFDFSPKTLSNRYKNIFKLSEIDFYIIISESTQTKKSNMHKI